MRECVRACVRAPCVRACWRACVFVCVCARARTPIPPLVASRRPGLGIRDSESGLGIRFARTPGGDLRCRGLRVLQHGPASPRPGIAGAHRGRPRGPHGAECSLLAVLFAWGAATVPVRVGSRHCSAFTRCSHGPAVADAQPPLLRAAARRRGIYALGTGISIKSRTIEARDSACAGGRRVYPGGPGRLTIGALNKPRLPRKNAARRLCN